MLPLRGCWLCTRWVSKDLLSLPGLYLRPDPLVRGPPSGTELSWLLGEMDGHDQLDAIQRYNMVPGVKNRPLRGAAH